MFMINSQITQKLIEEHDDVMTSRSLFIHNNGKDFSTFKKILYAEWSEKLSKKELIN